MRARIFCACLLTMPVALAIAASTPQDSGQKTALVTVVAESRAPVRNLSAGDFVVHEDKATRQVTAAEPATEPLSISLLVDTTQPSLGASTPTQDLRTALSTFVKTVEGASPDAQIALMLIAGAAVPTVDFTSNAADLDRVIQRLVLDQRQDSVLLEALTGASKQLGEKPPPRRAIVSVDFSSKESSAEQSTKKVVEDVHKSGATVWAISVAGTNATSSPTRDVVLNALTQANGGLRLTALDSSGLEPLLKQVANSLLSQYSITFVRQGTPNPKAIRIETTHGGKVLLSPWMR